MPDNTKTSAEADTVEIKQEITSSQSFEEKTISSVDTSPASVSCTIEEDKTISQNEVKVFEVTEITTTSSSPTGKKVLTKMSSITESVKSSGSAPGTPRKTMTGTPRKTMTGTPKKNLNAINNKKPKSDNNNIIKEKNTPRKNNPVLNSTKKPAVLNSPRKTNNVKKPPNKPMNKSTTNKPNNLIKKNTTRPEKSSTNKAALNTPRKTVRNRSASPKKKLPPKATSTPIKSASFINEETPTANGIAFEIKNENNPTGTPPKKAHSSRGPIKVASTRPPKIKPRARSPLKATTKSKKASKSSGAWR